jgi:hypothetical protein
MTTQVLALMLTVFVLGLFVGSNLSVILMCLLQVSAERLSSDTEMAPVSVSFDD